MDRPRIPRRLALRAPGNAPNPRGLSGTRPRPRARTPSSSCAHATSPTPARSLPRVSSFASRCRDVLQAPSPPSLRLFPPAPVWFFFFHFLNLLFLFSQVALSGTKLWHRWPAGTLPSGSCAGGEREATRQPGALEGLRSPCVAGTGALTSGDPRPGWTRPCSVGPAIRRLLFRSRIFPLPSPGSPERL